MDYSEINCILENIMKVEATLTCSDCNGIFKDPVIIGRCGHTFCQICVTQHIGKYCPTCKVPVNSKDSHEDKQLRELLPLVKQMKALFEDSPSESENPPSDEQPSATISETPLQDLESKSSSDEVIAPTAKKSHRVKKPTKCQDPDCCINPHVCLTPLKMKKSFGTSTPINAVIKKRSALASPITRKVKRSPFRSFHSFSTGKHLANKLKSPRANVSLSFPTNLERKNAKGETPLHVAVIKGDFQRVRNLLLNNANPNVQDNAGWTPLHESSNHGYLEITELLVKHGAVVDAAGPENITPLYDALMNQKIEVAKFLVSKDANLHAKVDQGSTPIELCVDESLKAELLEISANCKKAKEIITKKTRSPPEKVKFVLLSTSLGDHQRETLQNCADNVLKADIVNDFLPSVTHVVTSLDNEGQCNRTLKILRAILSGKWIVSYRWIEACMKHKKAVAEDEFEARGTKQQPNCQGPMKARHNMTKEFPRLFQNCHFYLYGQFTPPLPSKEDISQLIQLGGGKVLVREPKSDMVDLEKFHVPFHAVDGPLADICYYILYQDKPPRQVQIRANHICTVTVHWLINSISAFTLLEPTSVPP